MNDLVDDRAHRTPRPTDWNSDCEFCDKKGGKVLLCNDCNVVACVKCVLAKTNDVGQEDDRSNDGGVAPTGTVSLTEPGDGSGDEGSGGDGSGHDDENQDDENQDGDGGDDENQDDDENQEWAQCDNCDDPCTCNPTSTCAIPNGSNRFVQKSAESTSI